LVSLRTLLSFEVDPLTYISYRNCIFLSVDILINVDMLDIALQVLELVNDESNANLIQKNICVLLLFINYIF